MHVNSVVIVLRGSPCIRFKVPIQLPGSRNIFDSVSKVSHLGRFQFRGNEAFGVIRHPGRTARRTFKDSSVAPGLVRTRGMLSRKRRPILEDTEAWIVLAEHKENKQSLQHEVMQATRRGPSMPPLTKNG